MENVICHCFGYTVSDIERDIADHGGSTILERIMAEKSANRCDCSVKNPTGR